MEGLKNSTVIQLFIQYKNIFNKKRITQATAPSLKIISQQVYLSQICNRLYLINISNLLITFPPLLSTHQRGNSIKV